MSKRNFSHPLFGADLATLRYLFGNHGTVPSKYWGQVAAAFGAALLRSPAGLFEQLIAQRAIARMPKMKAPLFIVGHWRSGTTHLCNVLSKSPQFGYVSPIATGLPWELLTIGRGFRKQLESAIPADRLIDSVPVHPDSPQEDEFGLANMNRISFLHGLYFPEHFEELVNRGLFFEGCTEKEVVQWQEGFLYYLKKVSIEQNHKRLLIRNPVYTTRVAMLQQLFPDAKVLHIIRNPFRVFVSMRNYYKKLFPALAFQAYDHIDIEAFILENYACMMDRLIEESAQLPTENFLEIRYEALEKDPLGIYEQIYQHFGWEGFEQDKPYFDAYIESISSYQKNHFRHDPKDIERVTEYWGKYLKRWGYTLPQK